MYFLHLTIVSFIECTYQLLSTKNFLDNNTKTCDFIKKNSINIIMLNPKNKNIIYYIFYIK